MNAFEQLQMASQRLKEINEKPSKTQDQVNMLSKDLDLLTKVVIAMIDVLATEEQKNEIKIKVKSSN